MDKTMLKVKTTIGAVLFTLGLFTADSEWLFVPLILIALGAWLGREVLG